MKPLELLYNFQRISARESVCLYLGASQLVGDSVRTPPWASPAPLVLEQQWQPYPFLFCRRHEVLDRLPGDLATSASMEEEELAKASKPMGKSLAALLGRHAYFAARYADARERNESCPLDPSALEELEGGSTGRHNREREKALPPVARRPSTAAASAPQREGEGIAKRVEEGGEKREGDCGSGLGMRGESITVFLYSEREVALGPAVYRPIKHV
jgi:hypothetical protein